MKWRVDQKRNIRSVWPPYKKGNKVVARRTCLSLCIMPEYLETIISDMCIMLTPRQSDIKYYT